MRGVLLKNMRKLKNGYIIDRNVLVKKKIRDVSKNFNAMCEIRKYAPPIL